VNSRGCGRLYGGEWGVPPIEHDVSYGKIITYDIHMFMVNRVYQPNLSGGHHLATQGFF
jgi:hypothetical protein